MQILAGHGRTRAVDWLAFSPDGRTLASAGADRHVRLWDLAAGAERAALALPREKFTNHVAFSPDGQLLAWAGSDVRVWDLADLRVPVFEMPNPAEQVRFSPDGTTLVASASRIRLWEVGSWRLLPAWPDVWALSGGREIPTGAIAFRPDGAVLAQSAVVLTERGTRRSTDPEVRFWDARTGAARGRLRASGHNPRAIAYSPDGAVLAGAFGPVLRAWQVETGRELAARQVGAKHFKDLAFTPDGRTLVTASNDEFVRLWDTTTWQERGTLAWQVGRLGSVTVAPDGLRAAAAGDQGKIVVWDVDD